MDLTHLRATMDMVQAYRSSEAGRILTANTPRKGRLYHGCWAGQAEMIHSYGLWTNNGYVHLADTPGLAWAYGAWATGLVMADGKGVADIPEELLEGRVGSAVAEAMRSGPNVAAVCVVELPLDVELEEDPQGCCPALPWEQEARVAPCYRSTEDISPRWISEWRLYRVPELWQPGVVEQMSGKAAELAHDYPRGAALLEDLAPDPIGAAIPNGRRLVAAILDAAGPAADLDYHGPPHWTRAAAAGLDLHPDADLTVVLLFALLHDAARRHDGHDTYHGERAAELAHRLNGETFTLDDARMELLTYACAKHADGLVSDDPTIGAAWDADRLDIGRYGKRLLPTLMSTGRGRELAAALPETVRTPLREVLAAYAARLNPPEPEHAVEIPPAPIQQPDAGLEAAAPTITDEPGALEQATGNGTLAHPRRGG